jgi:hypothetical protein
VAELDPAQPDAAQAPRAQRVEQHCRRLDRVSGQPEGAVEDVGPAPWYDGEGRHPVVRPVGEQTVDHLVDRAVAAEDDDQVQLVAAGGGRELGGVAPVLGVDDLELELGLEGGGQHLAGARRGGRRGRIDHQQRPHGRSAYRRG